MLFHKFQKVPQFLFKCPGFQSVGEKLLPKKHVTVLPWRERMRSATVGWEKVQQQPLLGPKLRRNRAEPSGTERRGGPPRGALLTAWRRRTPARAAGRRRRSPPASWPASSPSCCRRRWAAARWSARPRSATSSRRSCWSGSAWERAPVSW